MRMILRIVIDTNVVVSALCFPISTPRIAFDLAREKSVILCSEECFSEIQSVLHRKKFDQYIDNDLRVEFLKKYKEILAFINIITKINECRDHKDNKFLELALDGNAEIIISGDNDLLDLDPFRGIRILDPVGFLEMMGS
jgi:putative PIN family toxin of toxin-antitoxin system